MALRSIVFLSANGFVEIGVLLGRGWDVLSFGWFSWFVNLTGSLEIKKAPIVTAENYGV